MSVIDDIRKLLQDLIAPELTALKEQIEAAALISDARYQSAQSQYAALQTHMELISQKVDNVQLQMTNNHSAIMDKLNALVRERA